MSIRYIGNLGRILGILIGLQVITGLILRIHYVSHVDNRFDLVISVVIDLDSGSIMRFIHCNGRRLLFLMVYAHIFKGIYYNRFSINKLTGMIGTVIYLMIILIAFLGYVLPGGQMRYGGATVIRRLITTIPVIGKGLLIIIGGDYSVNNRTLNRFYSLHFCLPLLILVVIIIHIVILHYKGRTTLMSSNKLIVPFTPYFILKDLVGFIFIIILLIINVTYFPRYFLDSENSITARPLVTPIHIVPEWYFLFAYCILKTFNNKVLGVIILILSVGFFIILALKRKTSNNTKHKIVMVIGLVNFIVLTKIGALELTYPYSSLSIACTTIHFAPILV